MFIASRNLQMKFYFITKAQGSSQSLSYQEQFLQDQSRWLPMIKIYILLVESFIVVFWKTLFLWTQSNNLWWLRGKWNSRELFLQRHMIQSINLYTFLEEFLRIEGKNCILTNVKGTLLKKMNGNKSKIWLTKGRELQHVL